MELKTETFDFEGVKYTISRVTAKQRSQIMAAYKQGEEDGNYKTIEAGLVSPKITREEYDSYDSAHVALLIHKITSLNTVDLPLNKPSIGTSAATA